MKRINLDFLLALLALICSVSVLILTLLLAFSTPAYAAVSTNPADWNFKFSRGVGRHPVVSAEGIWEFDFPFSSRIDSANSFAIAASLIDFGFWMIAIGFLIYFILCLPDSWALTRRRMKGETTRRQAIELMGFTARILEFLAVLFAAYIATEYIITLFYRFQSPLS